MEISRWIFFFWTSPWIISEAGIIASTCTDTPGTITNLCLPFNKDTCIIFIYKQPIIRVDFPSERKRNFWTTTTTKGRRHSESRPTPGSVPAAPRGRERCAPGAREPRLRRPRAAGGPRPGPGLSAETPSRRSGPLRPAALAAPRREAPPGGAAPAARPAPPCPRGRSPAPRRHSPTAGSGGSPRSRARCWGSRWGRRGGGAAGGRCPWGSRRARRRWGRRAAAAAAPWWRRGPGAPLPAPSGAPHGLLGPASPAGRGVTGAGRWAKPGCGTRRASGAAPLNRARREVPVAGGGRRDGAGAGGGARPRGPAEGSGAGRERGQYGFVVSSRAPS